MRAGYWPEDGIIESVHRRVQLYHVRLSKNRTNNHPKFRLT